LPKVHSRRLLFRCIIILIFLGQDKDSPKPKPRPRPAPRPRTKPQDITPSAQRELPKRPSNTPDEKTMSSSLTVAGNKENTSPLPTPSPAKQQPYEEELYDEPEMTLRSGT